jgi:LPXTG-motif cell wall-anchored protein
MKNAWAWLIGGIVLILVGVLWMLQGSGSLGATGGMNGKPMWLVIGAIVALIGAALIVVGLRRRRSGAPK